MNILAAKSRLLHGAQRANKMRIEHKYIFSGTHIYFPIFVQIERERESERQK